MPVVGAFAEPPNLVVNIIICRFRRTARNFQLKRRYYVGQTPATQHFRSMG